MTGGRARAIETLGLVLLCWMAGRIGYLSWANQEGNPPALAPASGRPPTWVAHHTLAERTTRAAAAPPIHGGDAPNNVSKAVRPAAHARPFLAAQETTHAIASARPAPAEVAHPEPPMPEMQPTETAPSNPPPDGHSSPVRASAWVLWRPEASGLGLGTSGQLGGSQAGIRLVAPFAFRQALRASMRATTALKRPHDAEVAPGLSLKPLRSIPVEIIVERRFRLSRNSQDATAAFIAGGETFEVSPRLTGTVYAQGGVVGLSHPRAFADGAAKLRQDVGARSRIGVGMWGGLQPGLRRLDVGPSLSTVIGEPAGGLTLSADWRFRIAGNARPGSGIAVTLAKDF